MANLYALKSTLCPSSISRSNFPRTSAPAKRCIFSSSSSVQRRKLSVCCAVKDSEDQSNGEFSFSLFQIAPSVCLGVSRLFRLFVCKIWGFFSLSVCVSGEEPPESLFMKELRRRGMTPTSLLEESKKGGYGIEDDETKLREGDRVFSKRNAVSTEIDKGLLNQRERSMALNSEGLEQATNAFFPNQGLIPRARLLLTIGGTFFLAFGPLILVTVGAFTALYLYFGASFVHDGSATPVSPPQYIDPYALLEDQRISDVAPTLK
ncbi:unnamed protein product [Linum tenue]|uniref:Tubulin alpha-6 chain n=1 Tax=Linum tenue TaxID=586396 RepID=A0AAV0HK41_9ROSI|nr:unnamed protein product [Linum tenue]